MNVGVVISVEGTQSGPEAELAKLITTTLNLNVAPESIDPDTALFNEGLGLDSIDILEIALAISKAYGFMLRSDDENNSKIFSSLRNLSKHVQIHRIK
jgi:acyl carrier protein